MKPNSTSGSIFLTLWLRSRLVAAVAAFAAIECVAAGLDDPGRELLAARDQLGLHVAAAPGDLVERLPRALQPALELRRSALAGLADARERALDCVTERVRKPALGWWRGLGQGRETVRA